MLLTSLVCCIVPCRAVSCCAVLLQFTRMKVLDSFRSGQQHLLVATDVAARGLDIKSIKTVINYDAARDIDTHIHRYDEDNKGQCIGKLFGGLKVCVHVDWEGLQVGSSCRWYKPVMAVPNASVQLAVPPRQTAMDMCDRVLLGPTPSQTTPHHTAHIHSQGWPHWPCR